MKLLKRIWRRILDPYWDIYEAAYAVRPVDELASRRRRT